ncbi:MAG: esterase/lipase family protein [Phycisphaerales bacterium]
MLAIIHGWSDDAASFKRLARLLNDAGINRPIANIRLADYITLDDHVTFDDLIAAMHRAWEDAQLPTTPRSIDLIVHSTGGLVARHWMTTRFAPETNPIRRLLMLAPANFGSHLAHKGRSFIGRVAKGFKGNKPFQTGTHILDGLELASPFTWNLALKDRFSSDTWYGPGRVLCTVLVGTAGYSGISSVANESGTDGTVRVSTANLNPVMIAMDFAADPQNPTITLKNPKGATAFARIPGVNHGSITLRTKDRQPEILFDLITRSLAVTDQNFESHVAELDAISERHRADERADRYTQSYQSTAIHLTDDHDQSVDDFFFELFAKHIAADGTPGGIDHTLTARTQREVFAKVHVYKANPARRSMLFNIDALRELFIDPARRTPLFASVTAMPEIRRTNSVGYATFGFNDIGSIRLDTKQLNRFFQPDRTALLSMKIRRDQDPRVFRFLPAS